MTKTFGAALLLIASCALAHADDAALERLRKHTDYQASRARTLRMGFYLGTKRIGSMTSTLGKSDREDAVYLERSVLEAEIGGSVLREEVTLYLAADLSLVSETKRSSQQPTAKPGEEPPPAKESQTEVRREGGEWVRVERENGEARTLKAPYKGPNYGPCLAAVAGEFAGTPGSFTLPGIVWKDEPHAVELKLEVSEPAELEHRGQQVRAVRIHATGKDKPVDLVYTPEGTMLQLAPSDAPVRFLAGTEVEIAADLPAKAAPTGGKDPLEAVKVYIYVLAGAEPIDALDRAFDWVAIRESMIKANPDVANLTPSALAETFKAKLKEAVPALPKEQADLLLGMLTPQIDGDTATIAMPGKEDQPFRLRKQEDGSWKVTAFPH